VSGLATGDEFDDMQSFHFSILITIRRAMTPRVTSSLEAGTSYLLLVSECLQLPRSLVKAKVRQRKRAKKVDSRKSAVIKEATLPHMRDMYRSRCATLHSEMNER
jgi:hypothetical protein